VNARSIAIANQHPRLRLDRRAVSRAIALLDASANEFPARPRAPGVPAGELSIVFMTDAALAQLHADFLDDPTITDVITFEGDPILGTAGEICVSADAALRHIGASTSTSTPARKEKAKQPVRRPRFDAAFSDELTLYMIHGWLHLAGYDDLQPAKKRVMRRAESRALRLLRASPAGLPRFLLA
jgi:probable rRNA maturation factor